MTGERPRPDGFTACDARQIMMIRIAEYKALPFEPLIPNAEPIEAMNADRRGWKRYLNAAEMLNVFNARD